MEQESLSCIIKLFTTLMEFMAITAILYYLSWALGFHPLMILSNKFYSVSNLSSVLHSFIHHHHHHHHQFIIPNQGSLCAVKESVVMVEQGCEEGSSERIGKLLSMASSSSSNVNKTPLHIKQTQPLQFNQYPPPLAKYEDVVANPKLFMDTLGKLHAAMGTKFMIPVIGGRDLDLHRAFVEVTSRGGIERVIKEKKWKEVTAVFNFPSSATNASFILRKYYHSLLYHYEQMYYFKAQGWTSLSAGTSNNMSMVQTSAHGFEESCSHPSLEIQAAQATQENIYKAKPLPEAPPQTGSTVMGVIDGKFESGYLVTVTVGSEKLKGVLYQPPMDNASQFPQHQRITRSIMANISGNMTVPVPPSTQRRRRRKKCEIKKRDPAHPKPNRSGYNFFFAEQHARLKPLHPGKDRDISRMIGELWNNLQENDKSVYQEKAAEDKERYKVEMEDYRERLRTGQIMNSNAMPIQQPQAINVMGPTGHNTRFPENILSFCKSDQSNSDDEKGLDIEAGVEFEGENVGPSTLTEEELQKRIIKMIDERPSQKQKVGDECAGEEKIGEGELVDGKVKESDG